MTSAPTYKVSISYLQHLYVPAWLLIFVLQPSESKREEFRKYLEKTGVMDALTKVLVSLYEEPDKPEDAIE